MSLALAPFFSGGLFPTQMSSLQAGALVGAAGSQDLVPELRRGTILYQIQDMAGWKMPRLNTLWTIPVGMGRAVEAMKDVDRWPTWMPRFSTSEKRPSPRAGTYLQEARMKAAGLTIHYRVEVAERTLDLGLQLYWSLEEGGFRKDRLALGLAINNGSCAFYPVTDNETFVAYAIHTQVSPLMPGTAGKITKTTIAEFPEFPAALARRASGHPLPYRMASV